MTVEELRAAFRELDETDEYVKFERIENKRCNRPDLHAFLLLDELVPGNGDIVCSAEHDAIYLDTDLYQLAEVISKEQVVELVRCGVMFGDNGLEMFA